MLGSPFPALATFIYMFCLSTVNDFGRQNQGMHMKAAIHLITLVLGHMTCSSVLGVSQVAADWVLTSACLYRVPNTHAQ